MNQDKLESFKITFEKEKKNLLYSSRLIDEDFAVSRDDLFDEVDQTSSEMEQSMRIRLRNREALYLKKIDQALARIREGTFGECLECEDEIDERRLEARPTTALCVACKEEQERKESLHIDSRIPKSVGKQVTLRSA